MRLMALTLASIVLLAGCADRDKRVFFDGNYYPTKAKKIKGDRESFVVSVRKAGQGLDGAREAGRHGGVKYCVETFGYSEIDWEVGPDADATALEAETGKLTMKGRCQVWE